jgi:hypothetical protein
LRNRIKKVFVRMPRSTPLPSLRQLSVLLPTGCVFDRTVAVIPERRDDAAIRDSLAKPDCLFIDLMGPIDG